MEDILKDRVIKLHNEGKGTREIARILGVKSPTISYYKRQLNLPIQEQNLVRNWADVQRDINDGMIHRDICVKYSFAGATLTKAYKRKLVTRPKIRSEMSAVEFSEIWDGLRANSAFAKGIKKRMFHENLWNSCCHECGLEEWYSKPAPLEVDHIDGDKSHNKILNLRLLCCNCHYFTPTWGNKKRI